MWWILVVTPAVGFAIQVSTGYIARSPDESYGGLGPDGMLFVVAVLLSLVILVRLLIRWRHTERSPRADALAAALAVIPLFLALAGIAELVGWPHTRTASALRFVAAAAIVVAWTASVLFARRWLRGTSGP